MSTERSDGVSVIVATYNGARFLREQLLSVANQTVRPAQVVLADDGSSDDTLEIAASTLGSYGSHFLKVLPSGPRPLGVAGNVHRALGEVTTEHVALCDQDDVWLPERLESALRAFSAEPAALVTASRARVIDSTGALTGATTYSLLSVTPREQEELESGQVLYTLLRRNLWPGMTFTMRTDFAASLPAAPQGWLHDYWYALTASTVGGFRVLDGDLVHYRLHDSNQLGLDSSGSWGQRLRRWKWLLGPERRRSTARLDQWHAATDALTLGAAPARQLLAEKVAFETMRLTPPDDLRAWLSRVISPATFRAYRDFDPDGTPAGAVDMLLAIGPATTGSVKALTTLRRRPRP